MIEQKSEEWFEQRLGKVTASKIADVMAKTKSGYSTSRANYMAQLVAERLTGQKQESFNSPAMQWGTDCEPFARQEYELLTGFVVTESGFVDHPTIAMSGASPDGLVGDDGLIEIKCGITATHIRWLRTGEVPEEHKPQMAFQLLCTDRKWCDFVSYDPRIGEELSLFVKRYTPEQSYLDEIESEVKKFLSELDDVMAELTEIKLKRAA